MNDAKRPARLEDLYVIRTPDDAPLVFTGLDGREVAVHVVKLNGPDQQAVDTRAAAVKARRLAVLGDKDHDEYLAHYLNVMEIVDESELIATIVLDAMSKPLVEIEARIRGQEKWTKDDRLEALELAWYGDRSPAADGEDLTERELGLMYLYEQPPEQSDDPDEQAENDRRVHEASVVWAQIQEFLSELDEAIVERRDEIADAYTYHGSSDDVDAFNAHLEELREKVVTIMIRLDADIAEANERLRQRVFYCTRQVDNWRKRHFGTLAELDNLPEGVIKRILDTYSQLVVGDLAGKGSRETPASSPPSDSSDEADPSRPSGHASASR